MSVLLSSVNTIHIKNDTGTETKVLVTTTTAVIRQRSTKMFGATPPVVAGIGAMFLLAVRLKQSTTQIRSSSG